MPISESIRIEASEHDFTTKRELLDEGFKQVSDEIGIDHWQNCVDHFAQNGLENEEDGVDLEDGKFLFWMHQGDCDAIHNVFPTEDLCVHAKVLPSTPQPP